MYIVCIYHQKKSRIETTELTARCPPRREKKLSRKNVIELFCGVVLRVLELALEQKKVRRNSQIQQQTYSQVSSLASTLRQSQSSVFLPMPGEEWKNIPNSTRLVYTVFVFFPHCASLPSSANSSEKGERNGVTGIK